MKLLLIIGITLAFFIAVTVIALVVAHRVGKRSEKVIDPKAAKEIKELRKWWEMSE